MTGDKHDHHHAPIIIQTNEQRVDSRKCSVHPRVDSSPIHTGAEITLDPFPSLQARQRVLIQSSHLGLQFPFPPSLTMTSTLVMVIHTRLEVPFFLRFASVFSAPSTYFYYATFADYRPTCKHYPYLLAELRNSGRKPLKSKSEFATRNSSQHKQVTTKEVAR